MHHTRLCTTSETNMMFLHSTNPSSVTIQVCSFHQQLHNEIHDHNQRSPVSTYRRGHVFLGLWELQWVWTLVHVTLLKPKILRRIPHFFFFENISSADKKIIESLQYISVRWCTQVSCWESKQENASINDNSNNPNQRRENETMKQIYYCNVVSLRCDKTFNRVSQITITYYDVCLSAALVIQHTKHMYHVLLSSVVWHHIFPHCLIKQHNF